MERLMILVSFIAAGAFALRLAAKHDIKKAQKEAAPLLGGILLGFAQPTLHMRPAVTPQGSRRPVMMSMQEGANLGNYPAGEDWKGPVDLLEVDLAKKKGPAAWAAAAAEKEEIKYLGARWAAEEEIESLRAELPELKDRVLEGDISPANYKQALTRLEEATRKLAEILIEHMRPAVMEEKKRKKMEEGDNRASMMSMMSMEEHRASMMSMEEGDNLGNYPPDEDWKGPVDLQEVGNLLTEDWTGRADLRQVLNISTHAWLNAGFVADEEIEFLRADVKFSKYLMQQAKHLMQQEGLLKDQLQALEVQLQEQQRSIALQRQQIGQRKAEIDNVSGEFARFKAAHLTPRHFCWRSTADYLMKQEGLFYREALRLVDLEVQMKSIALQREQIGKRTANIDKARRKLAEFKEHYMRPRTQAVKTAENEGMHEHHEGEWRQ